MNNDFIMYAHLQKSDSQKTLKYWPLSAKIIVSKINGTLISACRVINNPEKNFPVG